MLSLLNMTALNESPCFLPAPERLPARYQDCEAAVDEMDTGDTRVYTFGRGTRASGVTYPLPRTFRVLTCVITLDMVYGDQQDRLSIMAVREAALNLALQCTDGYYFKEGGISSVEPRNVLFITILGAPHRGIS